MVGLWQLKFRKGAASKVRRLGFIVSNVCYRSSVYPGFGFEQPKYTEENENGKFVNESSPRVADHQQEIVDCLDSRFSLTRKHISNIA